MPVTFTIDGPGGVRTWSSEEQRQNITVGRDLNCDIVLADTSVSRMHLRLHVDGEAVHFEDLGSNHGVTLNGQRVKSGEVRVGDQLQVTQTTMVRISDRFTRRKPSAPRFALEVTHPARPRQRFEFLTYKGLAFEMNGQVTTNGHFGRGGNPELLFIQWWGQTGAPVFHSVGVRRGAAQQPHLPALFNGSRLDRGPLKAGDTLGWHELTIVVSEVKYLRPPEWGMAEAARQNDAALQVYADWLETQGDDASAEWARLIPSQDEAARARMAVLARGLGASFRSTLARGPVERCAKKSCAERWESLSLEEEPWERTCAACTRTVVWCEDSETARSVRGPVVLDPVTPRTDGDLLPRPVMVG